MIRKLLLWSPVIILACIVINLLLPLIILIGIYQIIMYLIKSKKLDKREKTKENEQYAENINYTRNYFFNDAKKD